MSRYIPMRGMRTVSTEGIGTFLVLTAAITTLIALNNKPIKAGTTVVSSFDRITRNLDDLLVTLKDPDTALADKVTANMAMIGNGKKSPSDVLKEIKNLISTFISKGSTLVKQIHAVKDDRSIDSDEVMDKTDALVKKLSDSLKSFNGTKLNGYEFYAKNGSIESSYDRPSNNGMTTDTLSAKEIVDLLKLAVELHVMLPQLWEKLPMHSDTEDATGFGLNLGNMVTDTLDDVVAYVKHSLA